MSKAWKATERRIAERLSIWWTGHKKAFIRSPCSGGWPSARANGDMVANNDDPTVPDDVKLSARKFVAEWSMDVKRRVRGSRGGDEKWNIEELLTSPKHPIVKWWLEMCDLAKTRGTHRLLVVNKATYHSYVIFGEREMDYIKECIRRFNASAFTAGAPWSAFLGPSVMVSGVSTSVPEDLTMFELRSFLSKVDARVLGGLGNGPTGNGSGA